MRPTHPSSVWTALLAGFGLLLVSSGAAVLVATSASAEHGHKAFVCKYVGTPGVDERLQTGDNPIEVDSHAVQGQEVGVPFNDAQGRSVVIDNDVAPGDPEPSVEDCPDLNPPPPPPPPPPPTEVTAAAPAFIDPTCPAPTGSVQLPTTEGVSYSQSGTAAPGSTVTVTATALEGFVLTGPAEWSHTFAAVPASCNQVLPPENPPENPPVNPPAENPPVKAPPAAAPPVTPEVVRAGSVAPVASPLGPEPALLGLGLLAAGLVLLTGAGARSLARTTGGR